MKKVLLLLLAFVCLFLSACQKPQKTSGISVITSNFPLYDFVREIGGEQVNVTMLIKPGAESHSFEPTPKDMIAIEKADLFLYMGGESEAWVKSLTKKGAVAMLDWTEEHDEHDHGHDEHLWTSPKNAMKMAETICGELCRIDPENKDDYMKNLKTYLDKLNTLDQRFYHIVQNGERQIIVFGDRFPFFYFAEEYGLSYFAPFKGCASQAEPSASVLAELMETVKTKKIPVVFYLELSNQSIAKAISEATGAEIKLFHSCHNVSLQEWEEGATYLSLMNQNAERLEEALH